MLSKSLWLISTGIGTRTLSTNSIKCSAETATLLSQKREYFEKMNKDTTKPANWGEALPFEKLPGPKPLPIIGNMWRFLPFIGEYYNKTHMEYNSFNYNKYGKIFVMKGLLGMPQMVVIFDPKDIETLHRNEGIWPIRLSLTSFAYYRTVTRKDVFKGVSGVSSTQGEDWYNLRTAINPILMQPRRVLQYIASMDEVAGEFVDNIRHFAGVNNEGEMPADFMNEIYKWSLESIGVIAFDKHFGCLARSLKADSEPQQLINSAIEMFKLLHRLETQPSLWKYIKTSTWRRLVKDFDFITFTTLKYIDESLSKLDPDKPEHEMSVLQKLIKKDRQIAVATVMDMITAGIDTTGKSLGSTLYFLGKNPDKQSILRDELLKNLPNKDSPVTKEVLENSPYLKAVIRESNRIAPVAIGNSRLTMKDLVLGGYQIPKGTNVITLLVYASNQEEHFKQADKFIPERWLKTTHGELSYKNAHPFACQPFGVGPRSCVGKRLANLELNVALAKIIRNFEVSWPHKDATFSLELLYGIEDPLKLHMKPVSQ